jgi:hypothetical protein
MRRFRSNLSLNRGVIREGDSRRRGRRRRLGSRLNNNAKRQRKRLLKRLKTHNRGRGKLPKYPI